MRPAASDFQALLTPVDFLRYRRHLDLVEVAADGAACRHAVSSRFGLTLASAVARSRAPSSDGDTEFGEAREDERGDHRAFADRGGHPLRRAVANVACGEEPYAARFERE